MAEHNLNSLDPGEFFKMLKRRESGIAASDGGAVNIENSANLLAEYMHPQVQYLTVSDVSDMPHGCRLYTLTPDKERGTARLAPFAAGQYISVDVTVGGRKYSRPYSICSSPREAEEEGCYRIAVEAVSGGRVSNYIHGNWAAGTKITASAPMGNFVYEPLRDAKEVIGIAGGSGITPLLSMAKTVAEGGAGFSLTLLYGCRTRDDILFRETLDRLCRQSDRIKVVYILSEERADGYGYGLIDEKTIRGYLPEGEVSFFVCGPEDMYGFIAGELRKTVPERKYIRLEEHKSRRPDGEPAEVAVTVRSRDGAKKLSGNTSETLLEILEDGGVAPRNGCRSGECGFCRSRLISGEYRIGADVDGRRAADITHGIIHPCVTYPAGDIEIELL